MIPKAEAAEKILKIGTVAPLTLKEGVEIKRWMELFAKVVNEKGWLEDRKRYVQASVHSL